MPQNKGIMKTNVKVEQAAGRLVLGVIAVMTAVLVVFFVFGNNVITVL